MHEKTLKQLKKKLIQEKERLLKILKKNEQKLKEDIFDKTGDRKFSYHLADMATDEGFLEEISIRASHAHRRLKEVEEALARIEREEYGFCLKCAKNIEVSRLRAVPYAKYCIKCQEEIERKSGFIS